MAEPKKRGFASMDPSKQKEIASRGGKAAHAKGTAHEFNPESAREAGRRGGLQVSQNREHMSTIGREGGRRRGMNARRLAEQRAHEGQATPEFTTDDRPEEAAQGEGFRGEQVGGGEAGRTGMQSEPPMAERGGDQGEFGESSMRGEEGGEGSLDRDRGEDERKE